MTTAPNISLVIDQLELSSLSPAEAERFSAALERALKGHATGLAKAGAGQTLALEHLNITHPHGSSPEALASHVARQITGLMQPSTAHSGNPSRRQKP